MCKLSNKNSRRYIYSYKHSLNIVDTQTKKVLSMYAMLYCNVISFAWISPSVDKPSLPPLFDLKLFVPRQMNKIFPSQNFELLFPKKNNAINFHRK